MSEICCLVCYPCSWTVHLRSDIYDHFSYDDLLIPFAMMNIVPFAMMNIVPFAMLKIDEH